ncbi:Polyserase-2 [Frankliniella fusca]|uniref:Polyserase-2 n=1 Tax=Frankliniella fusca TaxID=407009 RepID=A0AAE1LCC7_9NEOP|nr:Polyserase-2 [Frankliniella fusca]
MYFNAVTTLHTEFPFKYALKPLPGYEHEHLMGTRPFPVVTQPLRMRKSKRFTAQRGETLQVHKACCASGRPPLHDWAALPNAQSCQNFPLKYNSLWRTDISACLLGNWHTHVWKALPSRQAEIPVGHTLSLLSLLDV